MATLTLAFTGHKEQVHDNACEGRNFLAFVSLTAEHHEFFAEVIPPLDRTTNCFST